MSSTTTIVVADELGDAFPPPEPGAEYVRDRRRRRSPRYLGRERRHRTPLRLERRDTGLAVVHSCPDCGRVSVVPWRPGGAVALGCSCAAIAEPAGASQAAVVGSSLVLLWLLNLADVVLTHKALSLGAVEANIVMDFLLRFGFVGGALIKIGFVTLGALLLWHERRRRSVYVGSVGLVVVYVFVVVYQIVALALIP